MSLSLYWVLDSYSFLLTSYTYMTFIAILMTAASTLIFCCYGGLRSVRLIPGTSKTEDMKGLGMRLGIPIPGIYTSIGECQIV